MKGRTTDGFTFLELMVVMVNLTIVLAIAIPTFLNWLPRYHLKAAARDLKSNFMVCKIRAIMGNTPCVIEFGTDRYTIDGQEYSLPKSAGVIFDLPAGVTPFGVEPRDGISFPGRKAIFRGNGRPQQMGAVYMSNKNREVYGFTVLITGTVKMRKWEGNKWKDL